MMQRVITRGPFWLLGGVGTLLIVLSGCSPSGLQRGQSAEENELQRYEVATIGERTLVSNADPISLGGVGLVEGLEGTGGDCNHDSYRAMLLDQLTKERVPDAAKLLKSSTCALVIIEAMLPPGAARGERIDVTVKLPPGSLATSLRGGTLRKCYLYNYDFAKNLRPDYQGSNSLMLGHKHAIAKGAILVGTGDGDEAGKVKEGKIWGGAECTSDNPMALVMNADSQRASLTSLISDRINTTFHGGLRGAHDSRLASTKDKMCIAIRVPPQYRLNLPRYLRVVRMIPLGDTADQPSSNEADKRSYRQKLAEDLLDPSRTIVAALRLEALGQKSVNALKEGLKHSHPLVRFASAESLAYLGSPACGEELHKAAIESPLFRAYALTAMASLDEAVCHLKLKELIASNYDDETRAGAFRALHTLNPNDEMVRGELLNDSFWLHQVAPETKSFIHLTTTKRAEVVLFGESPRLRAPFSFLAGEFAITAASGDSRCTVSRFPLRKSPARKQCGLELVEVLRTMGELGAQYPEVLALMQQASTCESLSCRVRVDALPQATSVHDLVQSGKEITDPLPAGQDLGQTPTLYQTGYRNSSR